MHARRQLPHRLIALLALLAPACVSDRYVGSIGPHSIYSNRGWGFALQLERDGLDKRWRAIDPHDTGNLPPEERPTVHDEPLDLNGDDELRIGETAHYLTPTLRLISKTSTGAEITIDVEIVGGKSRAFPLDSIALPQVRRLTKTASIAGSIEKREVGGYSARVVETPALVTDAGLRAYRVALVDQADFIAEEEIKRRQLMIVVLSAAEITPELRRDFETVLDGLLLNHHAGEQTPQEKW
jgi:hypothetical protein